MLLTIVLGFVILLLYIVIKGKPKNFPPGPLSLPLVGCFPFIPTKHLHFGMERWRKQYGPIVGLMLGSQPAVVICGAKEVMEVMRREECQGRPEVVPFRQDNFNRKLGVFFSDGPYWVEQRRFTLRHLRDLGFGKSTMEVSICEEIDDVIKEFREHKEFKVAKYFGLSTVNVIWALIAGTRFPRGDERLEQLLHAVTRLFRTSTQTGGILAALPILKVIAPQITGHAENLEHVTHVKAFFKNIIAEHLKTYNENSLRDFIDVYLQEMKLQSNKPDTTFTEDALIIICFDLFSAGAESISNTLSFSILYSILHPDVQRKVQKELDTVIGRDKRPCLDDKARLQYVEAVLAEVMRINTVAPIAPAHRVTQDTMLYGYNIPKNTTILASLWCLMHNKEHWGDPETFRPERFLDKDGNFMKEDWLAPFGIGKRTCLGEIMARNILFLFFTTLLQEFTFSLPEGHPIPSTLSLSGITTAPQPFTVKVTKRY